jgi:ABC-2 type transport system permease protein
MSANLEFQPVKEWHSLRGFANLFRKENRAWWGTRRWWMNALLWSGGLGGLVSMMLFILPSMAEATGDPNVAAAGGPLAFGLEMGRTVFFELGTMALAIGVIVLSQDLILDEKQSGLTEWLLAKPVARRAYLLAKLAASAIATLVLMIVLPALLAYALLSLRSDGLFPPLPFLAGVGVMIIHTLFYLTLTLMLGTFFNARPPILGLALAIVLGGNMLAGLLEILVYISPVMLAKVASMLAAGLPVPSELLWPPLMTTALWSLGFVWMALVKFEKTEI